MLDRESIARLEDAADKEGGWVVPLYGKQREKELKFFAEYVKKEKEKKERSK